MAAGHRVTIWDEPLDTLDRFRLLAAADAFVSLHRAEGFGLVIAEAMALGVPVVATGWSGNADFTAAENAALVAYDLKASDCAHGPYPSGTLWAEPRLDDAARQMRRVADDAAFRDGIAAAAARAVYDELSPDAVGEAVIEGAGLARFSAAIASPAQDGRGACAERTRQRAADRRGAQVRGRRRVAPSAVLPRAGSPCAPRARSRRHQARLQPRWDVRSASGPWHHQAFFFHSIVQRSRGC